MKSFIERLEVITESISEEVFNLAVAMRSAVGSPIPHAFGDTQIKLVMGAVIAAFNEIHVPNHEIDKCGATLEGAIANAERTIDALEDEVSKLRGPIPMILFCPQCRQRHIDPQDFKAHRTHACQGCGFAWRPANVATCGVKFLPGCKNED